jgi:hypothetical protein
MSPKQGVIARNKYNPSCQLKAWRSRLPTNGSAVEGQTIKEEGDIIIDMTRPYEGRKNH